MNHFKRSTKTLLFLLVLLIVGGQMACRQQAARSATQGNDAAPNLAAQSLTAASPATASPTPALLTALAPANFHRALVGSIGGKYDFRMELRRIDERLFGSYFYPRPGAVKYISLDGKVDAQGNVTLEESVFDFNAQTSKKTGEFKGKLDSVLDDGEQLVRFSGQWTRASDKQTLSFAAQEPQYDLGSLRLARQTQKDESQKQRYSIETNLPQLAGDTARAAKFNQTVRNFAIKGIGEFKKSAAEMAADPDLAKLRADAPPNTLEIDYLVNFADPNFISLLFSFYEFTGGAHGNTATSGFNYDLQRGQLVRLGEVFKPGSNYLKVISDYAISELKKLGISDDEWIRRGAGPKPENYDSWNITPYGLRITFDAYQVAAYAVGPQEVIVPYSLLKDIVKPDGPLAQFVK